MIIATAGHIDHGKTRLVRALTGVDTDRLPEERARGISIDLGFAYWTTPDGHTVGFVDVPGHERFVRNMVAGVSGIDYFMLVVAADDGIMPQTVEHLRIVSLLGVRRGVAVVTKVDRVDEVRRREVMAEVSAFLAASEFEHLPVIAVSAVTGEGVDSLRVQLARAAAESAGLRDTVPRHFRFSIDRAFTVSGSGTVVTGTVVAGAVEVGDRAVVSPNDVPVRVRGLQKQGRQQTRAFAGERCAFNLSGVAVEQVSRGQWLVADVLHAPTSNVDVTLEVLPTEKRPLEHWTPVVVHHGTSSVTGRVALRRSGHIEPGSSGQAQLRLERPLSAMHGDRFIVRDTSASRTVGGGVITNPRASASGRHTPTRVAERAAWGVSTIRRVLADLLACSPLGLDLARCEIALNVQRSHLESVVADARGTIIGRPATLAIAPGAIADLRKRTLATLMRLHEASAPEVSITQSGLRHAVAPSMDDSAFAALLRSWADQGHLDLAGSQVRAMNFSEPVRPGDTGRWQRVRQQLLRARLDAPTIAELGRALGESEDLLRDLMYRRMRAGELIPVTKDRLYLRSTLADLAEIAQQCARSTVVGTFTAADFRDRATIGRNLAIEILECFDRLGLTQRQGNSRILLKDPAALGLDETTTGNTPARQGAAEAPVLLP